MRKLKSEISAPTFPTNLHNLQSKIKLKEKIYFKTNERMGQKFQIHIFSWINVCLILVIKWSTFAHSFEQRLDITQNCHD